MKTIAFHNLGCKVNAYELDVMQQIAQNKGYEIVQFDQKADAYVVNTCSVTNIADRKSRQILHKAKKTNPSAIVVAAGCYAQIAKDTLLEDEAVDVIVGNNNKSRIIEIIEDYETSKKAGKDEKLVVIEDVQSSEYENMLLTAGFNRTRADVKIQDGCDRYCTYCIIPYTRGKVRSRELSDLICEVKGLANMGFKEVVLTGIHISSYGKEHGKKEYNSEALLTLIEKVAGVEGISRVRIGSFEPTILTEEFVERLSHVKEICPHFHISLQSGCDGVLKRMNRHYNTDVFYEKVCLLRKYFPGCAITTDVIVGFPGETEEEFEATVEYLKKVKFFETHIFPYSRRKGTVADKMEGQLSSKEKEERVKVLLSLDEEISNNYRKEKIANKQRVLIEEKKLIENKEYYVGHTREYVMIAVEGDKDISINEEIEVTPYALLRKDCLIAR